MIELLNEARNEIVRLRKRNEILEAKSMVIEELDKLQKDTGLCFVMGGDANKQIAALNAFARIVEKGLQEELAQANARIKLRDDQIPYIKSMEEELARYKSHVTLLRYAIQSLKDYEEADCPHHEWDSYYYNLYKTLYATGGEK